MPIASKKKAPRSVWIPPPRHILQLKVSLRYIKPPIWRRILVPDNLLLGDLHYAIYPVMGWYGYHMHSFRFGGGFNPIEYASRQTVEECDPRIRDEDSVLLAQMIKRKGQTFSYEYDFGDGWQHEIKVEKLIPYDPAMRLPVCLAGARACERGWLRRGRTRHCATLACRRVGLTSGLMFHSWVLCYQSEIFIVLRVVGLMRPLPARGLV